MEKQVKRTSRKDQDGIRGQRDDKDKGICEQGDKRIRVYEEKRIMVPGAQYIRGSGDHRQHMTPQHSPQPHPSATSLQPLGLSRLHQLSPSHSPWWPRSHSTPSRSAAPSPACITPHPYFYKHTPYKPPCTASSTLAMHIHHPTHMLLTIGMQVCNTRAHPAPHTTGYCCPGKGPQ